MPTRTAQRRTSTRRFARTPTGTSSSRFHRPTTRGRQSSSSPLSAITKMLPTSGARHAPRGANKSKAGLAALAGVAGLALKNRSRLTSRFGRKDSTTTTPRV